MVYWSCKSSDDGPAPGAHNEIRVIGGPEYNKENPVKSFILLSALFLLVPHCSNAQQTDAWGKFGFILGEWIGEGGGAPGAGSGSFSFLPDLGGKILVRKNHSEYPADKDKPPVVHDDLLIVYRDAPDPDEKAIYFDNEGHVIHYDVTVPSPNTAV